MTYPLSLSRKGAVAGLVAGVALAAVFAVAAHVSQSEAAGTVLIRGVVKPGGASDSVNVYITHVAEAPDATAIRGIRTDVNIAQAKRYKWEVVGNELKKVRTTSVPTPEKEVVIRGTLRDDNRITASWIVQNYREFTIEGTLQDRTIDTGKSDEGWVTVNVTSSKFRNVLPVRAFKETAIKGKDLRIRINGLTSLTALGKAKNFDEVTAGQQKVRIEGQMTDEYNWTASKFNELNE